MLQYHDSETGRLRLKRHPTAIAAQGALPPKVLEPRRPHLRIPHRVLDIAMPKVRLQSPGIVASIGQRKVAGMPEHMRMRSEQWLELIAKLDGLAEGDRVITTEIGRRGNFGYPRKCRYSRRLAAIARSLARNFGRFAPKAANAAASLWSVIFQYPKLGSGAVQRPVALPRTAA